MKKMMIVYYSYSNMNTEKIAIELQKATDADIFRIDTVTPYTGSHSEVVEQGQQEVRRDYRPPIKEVGATLIDYDIIAVGTPTWWYTMAPAMLTFLKNQDWKGKTVIPFMTNGGWPGHVIKDMKNACRGAKFVGEMEIQFDSTGGPNLVTDQKEIDAWVKRIKQIVAN